MNVSISMDVPLFVQGEMACGPTALRMAMATFGENVSEKEVVEGVGGLKDYGVRTIRLAEYARNRGYNTECLSYNWEMSEGLATISRPSMRHILKFLRNNIPVIISVRAWLLYDLKPSNMGHFIVITGYENGFFSYNDPETGKKSIVAKDKLFAAWNDHILDSSAYLLAIWK